MTDTNDINELSAFDEVSEVFEQNEDPLSSLDDKFKQLEKDPAEIYKRIKIAPQDITEETKEAKCSILDKWKSHMNKYDRHHACPSVSHAIEFINLLLTKDYCSPYLNSHLSQISKMFQYWIEHPKMPHGRQTTERFNPIDSARALKKTDIDSQPSSKKKTEYRMSIEEIGSQLRQIKNILHRTTITTQFKFGSRGGQVCNIQLPDLQLHNDEINSLYPEMGTHQRLQNIEEETIHFPPRSERPGNKSTNPIIIPIDRELKTLLIKYLRQRPPIDEPWLFVNNGSGNKLTTDHVTQSMWKPAFHPEYNESDQFEAVTSHYARHRFTTYWQTEFEINRAYLKYMRGDEQHDSEYDDSIDDYVEAYYEDIKNLYLSNIYTFDIL